MQHKMHFTIAITYKQYFKSVFHFRPLLQRDVQKKICKPLRLAMPSSDMTSECIPRVPSTEVNTTNISQKKTA